MKHLFRLSTMFVLMTALAACQVSTFSADAPIFSPAQPLASPAAPVAAPQTPQTVPVAQPAPVAPTAAPAATPAEPQSSYVMNLLWQFREQLCNAAIAGFGFVLLKLSQAQRANAVKGVAVANSVFAALNQAGLIHNANAIVVEQAFWQKFDTAFYETYNHPADDATQNVAHQAFMTRFNDHIAVTQGSVPSAPKAA